MLITTLSSPGRTVSYCIRSLSNWIPLMNSATQTMEWTACSQSGLLPLTPAVQSLGLSWVWHMAGPFPVSASLLLFGTLPVPHRPPRVVSHPFPWPSSCHFCCSICSFITTTAFCSVGTTLFLLGYQLWPQRPQLQLFSGLQPCSLQKLYCRDQSRRNACAHGCQVNLDLCFRASFAYPPSHLTWKLFWSVLLNFNEHRNQLRILLQCTLDWAGLEWGLRFCISNSFPDHSNSAGQDHMWISRL